MLGWGTNKQDSRELYFGFFGSDRGASGERGEHGDGGIARWEERNGTGVILSVGIVYV